MIGFKVIDTRTGEFANGDFFLQNNDDILMEFNIGFTVDYKTAEDYYKAVPSITIDRVEYYHGMVFCYNTEQILGNCILMYVENEATARWEINCVDINDENTVLYRTGLTHNSMKKSIIKGNVWKPEYRHLLPLLEEWL